MHTGYTGTFILLNLKTQQAVIFLSNRVHLRDERKQWIADRNVLIQTFKNDENYFVNISVWLEHKQKLSYNQSQK
jgi:CubicO group peptidase (beta-lactamase class C family)